ncbi:MAG TPA: hypothetical protein DC056_01570 [Dehalococcoidia bacterium]|nr:hypothetical protein [Dehalococcoidia bacterium]
MPNSTTPKPQRRKRDRLPEFLTQEQVRQLFSVIKSKRDIAIFKVAYRHGLRASEVGMLEKTDLDLKRARITINRLKGSLSGVYPMSADTVKALRSYLRTRDDEVPFLFPSNRRLPIDRRTLTLSYRRTIWDVNPSFDTSAGTCDTRGTFTWTGLSPTVISRER